MATIKAYTDLEQSKKLAEILPLESADACWTNHLFDSFLSSWRVESTPLQEYKYLLDRFIVKGYLIEPAWSLAALLGVLPNGIVMNKDSQNGKYHFSSKYIGTYVTADNPVDACYELILKLHENNKL